jgi:hypothetical protein
MRVVAEDITLAQPDAAATNDTIAAVRAKVPQKFRE